MAELIIMKLLYVHADWLLRRPEKSVFPSQRCENAISFIKNSHIINVLFTSFARSVRESICHTVFSHGPCSLRRSVCRKYVAVQFSQ